MRTNLKPSHSSELPDAAFIPGLLYRLAQAGDPDGGASGEHSAATSRAEHEDLPFKVELWDEAQASVEQVLAVTANGSIGYAAFYAATRDFPDRYITLRHKSSIVSRWNAPRH